MKEFDIVFIDDNFSETSPLVQYLEVSFPNADVHHVFTDPEKGVKYVLENLDKRMIVFMDWNYSGNTKKGIVHLREIRKRTSLLYVVMMSANQIKQNSGVQNSDLVEMMNEDSFYYFDSSMEDNAYAVKLVHKIISKWNSRFDCVLEQWLIHHPEDRNKVVMRQNGKEYTWEEILHNVRTQTSMGRDFERRANQATIYRYKDYE